MKRTYVVFILAVIANCVLSENEKGHLSPEVQECLKENGLNEDFPHKVMVEKQLSLVDESKCLAFCIMEKLNFLDNSKHIMVEKFKEHLVSTLKPNEPQKLDKLSDSCPEINETMDCDKARSLQKCMVKL